MDLTDIYRTFHSRATAFTFLSGAYGIFSKIYHILSHKSSLNKYNNTEIIPVVFFHYNGMKLVSIAEGKLETHKYVEIKQRTIK